LDPGHSLLVQVVHQPPQDPFVKHRIRLADQIQDDDPIGLALRDAIGLLAARRRRTLLLPILDAQTEPVSDELDELFFFGKEGVSALLGNLFGIAHLDGADHGAP